MKYLNLITALTFLSLIPCQAQELNLVDFDNKWSGSFEEVSVTGTSVAFRATVESSDMPSYIEKTFETPISMDRKFVRTQLKVSELDKLSGIELRLSSESSGYSNFFAIPIPTFTDRDFNIIQDEAWVDYTFSMGEARVHGTPDIDNIVRMGFYLGGNQVDIDFKYLEIMDAEFPGIVSITFDDGYDDNFEAAQIMAKYDLTGTAYIMPRQIGDKNYMTEEELETMRTDLGWSISSHHKIPIVDFTLEELALELEYTIDVLSPMRLDRDKAEHFAYPLGKQRRATTLPIMRKLFKTARIAGGGAETLPPSDWHMLRAYNVMPHISPEEIIQRIKKAEEQGEWLILMFHYISDTQNPETPLAYGRAEFERFCQLLAEEAPLVLPVDAVYEAFE